MNSAAARSNRSRSAGGWFAVETAARSEAALMRTPRLESEEAARQAAKSERPGRFRAYRARRSAPSDRDPTGLSARRCCWRARNSGQDRSVRWRERTRGRLRRQQRRQEASLPPADHSMPHGMHQRSFENPPGSAHTNFRRRQPPIRQICPYGNRCRHWACRALLTSPAAEHANCDHAADR